MRQFLCGFLTAILLLLAGGAFAQLTIFQDPDGGLSLYQQLGPLGLYQDRYGRQHMIIVPGRHAPDPIMPSWPGRRPC